MENIKELVINHVNSYCAIISGESILNFSSSKKGIELTVVKNYDYESFGTLRWETIDPMDKDEITLIQVHTYDDENINIYVPYKDNSLSGSYAINEYSSIYSDERTLTIKWENKLE